MRTADATLAPGTPRARPAGRGATALALGAQAWHSMERRHWGMAAGYALAYGAAQAAGLFLAQFQRTPPGAWLGTAAVGLARWMALMLMVAGLVAFACALLAQLERRSAARWRHVAATIAAIAVLGAAADLLAVGVARAVHAALGAGTSPFWVGVDTLTLLGRMWAHSVPEVVLVTLVSALTVVYIGRTRRAAGALADAQWRLADAQRRALAEELRTAQATAEPAFLFDTLNHIERSFEDRPIEAQRLLDALIRYLRAALPADGETIGTLGQQAELVRAWLEIESIRGGGRPRADVDVPQALEQRPYAPHLMLPLVSLALGERDAASRAGVIAVRASIVEGRLVVQVDDDRFVANEGSLETVAHAALRRRIATLYGPGAQLTVAIRQAGGVRATIVIDDPGVLAR
jgi:hypothetical protein